MSGALAGKVALVTGASRGIGRAIARKLASEGCDIAVNYYNSEAEAETLCAEIHAMGRQAWAIQASGGMPDRVGVVDTDALRYFPNRDELLANFAHRTPAGPVLTPEDVAGAVYLLCLPEARMITGHTLVVDGGFCISG